MPAKSQILDFGGMEIRALAFGSGYAKAGRTSTGRKLVVPLGPNTKIGASAGWTTPTTAGARYNVVLPASQTAATLICPIHGLSIGDTLTGVGVTGQCESAGGTATLAIDVRKQTSAAADITDASLGTDASGNLTADTIINSALVGVTGLSDVVAEGEVFYAVLTGTTAASTDFDITGLVVTFIPAS